MRPFTILNLMVSILVLGVGLAALRYASQTWAELLSTILALTLGYAVIAVVYRRGRVQAWWFGFALFAGGYQLFALAASSGATSPLMTTSILDRLRTGIVPSLTTSKDLAALRDLHKALVLKETLIAEKGGANAAFQIDVLQRHRASVEARIGAIQGSPVAFLWEGFALSPASSVLTDRDQYLRVGHCLFAVMAGLLGAALACRAQGHASRVHPEPV